MNFLKYSFVFLVIFAVFSGQTEAGWLRKIGKKIERAGQRVRDATIKALPIAQDVATVVTTFRG